MLQTFFQIGSAICLNLEHVDVIEARSSSDNIVKSNRSAGYGSSSSFKKACFGLKQLKYLTFTLISLHPV